MASLGTGIQAPSSGLAKSVTMNRPDPATSPLGGSAPFASGQYAGLSPDQMTQGGYQWDIGQQKYVKNPAYAGGQAGQYTQGYLNAVPSLNGLTGAAAGAMGGGVGGAGGVTAGAGGGSGTPGAVSGGGTGASFPTLQMPDTSAATTAAFARAKDQAGQMTRSSLDSLAGELGSQGMLGPGSGAMAQGAADILTKGTNLLGEESRNEATDTSNLNADFLKTGYTGGIAQRGQNMAQQTAYRGQDVAAQEANARLALESRQQIMSMLSLAMKGIAPSGGQAY